MSIWIKICGLTTREAVNASVEANVDAVGFVFAPSKRRVTAEQARALAVSIPAHIARVAVMLHPAQAEVDEVLSIFRPDVLQTDADDLKSLTLPTSLTISAVFRAGATLPQLLPRRLMFEGPVSGTGELADWQQAAKLAERTELILAGGLNPTNVASAIDRVRPFGVDVSSGVEQAPGIKSVEKIQAFVAAARSSRPVASQVHGA